MSDLSDLHEHENRPKKKNPFRSKPIPKSRIMDIESYIVYQRRAQFLGVIYNTFKKYISCMTYSEQNKNQSGVGITTKGNTGWE